MHDIAGLILNDSAHYVDHLAPFCSLKGYPLIVCEPSIASLVKTYYPNLQIVETSREKLILPKTIVSCYPRPILESCFPYSTFQTKWLPHGNSDKGWKSALFEHLYHEETLLVYGPKMIDAIAEKIVDFSHLNIEQVGNFRKIYFEKHRIFYRKKLLQAKMPTTKLTFLYAPTWHDLEGNCSLWDAICLLVDHLPDTYTLLIKPHPNTISAFAPQIERLIGRYQNKNNLFWITDFPPIYPLIDLCDGYIGDMSSIGYDFLSKKNCPLYFLNHQQRDLSSDKGLYLYQCGTTLSPEQFKDVFILDQNTRAKDEATFGKIRQKVYNYTFGKTCKLGAKI